MAISTKKQDTVTVYQYYFEAFGRVNHAYSNIPDQEDFTERLHKAIDCDTAFVRSQEVVEVTPAQYANHCLEKLKANAKKRSV